VLFQLQDQLAQIVVPDDGSSLWDGKPPNLSLPYSGHFFNSVFTSKGKTCTSQGNDATQSSILFSYR
jgi:hypothetical protein